MPKHSLTELANPKREFKIRNTTIKWRALTLGDLAEIEAQYGSINEFFDKAAAGSVQAILDILARAMDTDPSKIGELFLAGDFREGAPAHQLLLLILEASGVIAADANEKKADKTGQESTL